MILRDAVLAEGLDHQGDPLGRGVGVGRERGRGLRHGRLDDVARNQREDARPDTALRLVGDELVDVALIGQRVAA